MDWPASLVQASLASAPETVAAYAELTHDFNPIHLDPAFAATTSFGRPIVHGTWSLNALGLAMVLALDAVQSGNRRKTRVWLLGVIVLGGMFLGGQVFEFSHFYREGLTLQQNLFGATFFVLTGFHGAHVTVGVIWMTTLLVMSLRGKLGPDRGLDVEVAGLYWHFVDVVWIVIFTVVYLIQ